MSNRQNRVVHFEIHAANPVRASKFYSKIFGWDINLWKGGNIEYRIVMTGKKPEEGAINGGLIKRMGPSPKLGQAVSSFVCIIEVPNVEATLKKVLASGGKVALPIQEVPQVGKFAYFIDTEGNLFGVIKSAPPPKSEKNI